MQSYFQVQHHFDQSLNTTVHQCELCPCRYGGFELLMHIHYVHNLDYSDICPCDNCVVIQLHKMPAMQSEGVELPREVKELFQLAVMDPAAQWAPSQITMATPRGQYSGAVSSINFSEHTQRVPAQITPTRNYSGVANNSAFSDYSTPIANGNTTFQHHSSPLFNPDDTPSRKRKRDSREYAPPQIKHDIRVDSASPAALPSLSSAPALKTRTSAKQGPKLIPVKVRFVQESSQISERNLPYELSKIEAGDMYEDNGEIVWSEKKTVLAPEWIDGNDQPVKSVVTKRDMHWFLFLPHNIPHSVTGWQLAAWHREAAAQGLKLQQKDLMDRMPTPLSSSALTSRVQAWQTSIGMLSQKKTMNFSWPSRLALDTVAQLNYLQARFNTWWDVQYLPSHGVYAVRQPHRHPGYRDIETFTSKNENPPYYFIENPETRKVSEQVNLVDDAMLFLSIKAEECGMKKGYGELLSWLGTPTDSAAIKNLDTDLLLEFQRWRKRCPDTPSVNVLRTALNQATSQTEVEAIKRADYSLTPWLQNVVTGLLPERNARRIRDEQTRAEVAVRLANRKTKKRTIEQVDEIEEGAGVSKKQCA